MKKDRLKKISGFVLAFFFWSNILSGVGLAAPEIPGFYGAVTPQLAPPAVNTLPVLRNVVQGASVPGVSNNRLVIHQNQSKAIINWESFNIGEDASTHFDQQGNADWAALNRIFDRDPSRIFGALTADGKIYLINQNGILFGSSSRVNVHSLTASSLNIKNDDFLNGLLKFKTEDYNFLADNFADVNTSVVSNHGVIETDKSGSVFLLSPIVENSGTISTFFGQAGLIAGKHVEFESGTGQQDISVKECGDNDYAVNTEQGRIYGDYGVAGMYGRVVQQDGLITSVSAVKQSGRIELRARDKIVTGNKSMSLCPVTTSNEKEHSSFPFEGGEITLSGLSDIGDGKLERIEHQGVICAPPGKVRLEASQRVYLESESEIDVSGLWIERALEYDVIKAQLNTAQLADEYGQKYGLLHGEWIEFHQRYGSSIGDLSGHLANEKFTAGERSTEGGEIYINVSDGDIICRQGSSIDFSGGGIHHQSGLTDTTQLISGNRLYDISEAPAWIKYDKFAGYFENIHERYGLVDEYKGVFYGSGAPIKNYISEYTEGSNAGSLELIARNVVLDGQINASVERGIFQTLFQEPEDENGNQSAAGYVEPKGGTLSIGTAPTCENGYVANDSRIEEIVVREEVDSLPETFGTEDEIPDSYFKEAENESCLKKLEYQSGQPVYKTMLSAKKLSDAGLSALNLNALTRVTIDNDALLSLRPSGLLKDNEFNLSVTARNIHHRGTVDIPGGKAGFFSVSNITSGIGNSADPENYVSLKDRIYIADGSKILVNGEQIDDSYVNQGGGILSKSGHLDGGHVQIENYSIREINPDKRTSEVVIEKGSLIDVSGGYEIDGQGNVSGGDAGVLDIQGATLVLRGELKGYSLIGQKGGTVNIHSGLVNVKNSLAEFEDSMAGVDYEGEIPDDLYNTCYLAKDYFDETGFTNIGLTSVRELIIDDRVHFSPSMMKMSDPFPGSARQTAVSFKNFTGFGTHAKDGLVQVSPDYITSSSVHLTAGKKMAFTGQKYDEIEAPFDTSQETFFLHESSLISVPSEGSISITAPGIEISGQLHARSGDVQLTASAYDIVLKNGSKILAGGYNRPQTSVLAGGLRGNFTPVDGGSVDLKSKSGSIDVEQGALIDVSGSSPVVNHYRGADGTIYTDTDAGNSGSVSFSYFGDLDLNGKINARTEGLMGGSLTIGRTNTGEALSIAPEMIDSFTDDGFDAFTFSSYSDLVFQGEGKEELFIRAGRRLTLDAPEIIAGNNWNIRLKAPWIQLSNTYDKYDVQSLGSGFDPGSLMPDEVQLGESMLTLQGNFIDVAGSLGLSGFKNVSLEAGNDLCFAEEDYGKFWEGKLLVPGDLFFTASRIYPTTDSRFTIQSNGKVTTCSNGKAFADTIYSAGGSLTIKAKNIEHNGFLAAPLGEIVLETTGNAGRIFLGEGSVISTKGALPVKYGAQGKLFWTKTDKDNPQGDPIVVETAPEGTVTIISANNGEIIMKEGAEIDVSGGGSVFSYLFQPGIEGSGDPLKKEGCYVILPDNSVVLPGEAVYLEGADGLPAGTYSLLPEEYAFAPGAIVITDLGMDVVSGESMVTREGYTVVTGYATVMGTGVRSQKPRGYAIRPAEDVLKEGNFTYSELTAGNAGSVTLNGPTTILDGTIKGDALPGYQGGFLSMSAAANAVVRSSLSLPHGFGFDDDLDDDLVGMCMVSSDGLAGRGLRELIIGDPGTTGTITLEDGSILDASIITLSAEDAITLESGTQILALGEGGTASLISPDGEVIIEENALVHASNAVNLETSNFTLDGEMKVDNSTLNLQGDNIFIVPDDYAGTKIANTIYLTESLCGLTGFDNIGFISRNDLTFLGNVDLEVAEEFTINAKRISGDPDGGKTSNITSQTINLLNTTGDASIDDSLADTCLVTFNADDMTVGHGDILFDGFSAINLNSNSDLTFKGKGSLASSGDLNMSAARVTTSCYQDAGISYEVADFQVDAGDSAININKSGGIAKNTKIPGGRLELLARTIDHSGIVDVTSGRMKFVATGSGANNGIFLKNGSRILARGSDYATGGLVDLQTEQGALNIEAGSKIDVSAGGQGDAGAVSLYAPAEGVVIDGDVEGYSQGGRGGSFDLDTKELDNFSSLNAKLADGGFNEEVNIRARSGNVGIAADDTVVAHKFNLTVDKTEGGNDGNINLLGEISASGDKGGMVELYAGNNLNLDGTIDAGATGTNSAGGEVFLNAAAGTVNFNTGSSIDVSAGENGEGGKVSFRAMRDGNDVKMNLNGTITEASRVTAEAVKIYEDSSISSSDISTWKTGAQTFMDDHAADIETRLLAGLTLDDENDFHLLPGIEIQSATDLTLAYTWDLTSWRYGTDDDPGVLTLRATGDLNINYDLVDHPTNERAFFVADGLLDSWEINLIAGAEVESASPFQVNLQETGDFTVKEGKLIYTESAPLRFFSGGDTHIEKEQDYNHMPDYMFNLKMPYNIATYDGIIKGVVGRDLIFDDGSGAIHSAVGDIYLSVENNLNLGNTGAVRTTGTLIQGVPSYIYECYNNGGDIQINAGGDIEGSINNKAWDQSVVPAFRMWTARYQSTSSYDDNLRTTAGIATMAGGDIAVTTGGDVFAQIGVFGDDKEDMLSINSGGNINGRFLVRKGAGEIHSLGNFGTDRYENQHIELFDAQIHLTAQGDVDIGAILNPTISRPCFSYDSASWIGGASGSGQSLQYTEQSAAVIESLTGDIMLRGKSGPYEEGTNECSKTQRALPPTVEMYAPEGDINFEGSFVLAPSGTGNLVLSAGGNIKGTYIEEGMYGTRTIRSSVITMSDRDPATVYNDYDLFSGVAKIYEDWNAMDMNIDMLYNGFSHADPSLHQALHQDDTGPVVISSANGDVFGFDFYFPKKMEITAGRDIRDFKIFSQNLNAGDISFLKAGRDIVVQSSETAFDDTNLTYQMGVSHGGPGSLIVQAGNSMDLGISVGLQTTNHNNPYLDGSSSLYVISGYDKEWDPEEISNYFSDLREAGNEYAVLSGTDQSAAMQKIDEFRENVMGPFFSGSSTGTGNIEMAESHIKSTEEDGDLYILAAGNINVGRSVFKSKDQVKGQDCREETGIYTQSGSALNIFSVGDVNVLESRVMTFKGGDITIWSDTGDINAGRGSKTAITEPRTETKIQDDGSYIVTFHPPAVGSGIRTLTFDPDGEAGPEEAPPAGDAYIFAPKGVIDAGEAGISASNVILGATAVLNAQNIEVGGVSVGVPVTSEGASGLGALAGAGSLTETSGLTEDVAGLDTGEDTAEGYSEPEDYTPTWLKVKVVGFDEEEEEDT